IWMSRLAGTPRPDGGIPQSVSLHGDWDELKRERKAFDAVVIEWADRLDAASLAGELAYYSGAIKPQLPQPTHLPFTPIFTHHTHPRGQVHCRRTAAAAKPGDTDCQFLPM